MRPEVNVRVPSDDINRIKLKIPSNIRLADPEFHKPGEIDALVGAEIFMQLICVGQLSLTNGNVILQKTELG